MFRVFSNEELDAMGVKERRAPEQFGAGGSAGCASCSGAYEHAFCPMPQPNGNLQVDPDIHLPSPGMDVDISLFYNATSTQNGPFGYGRSMSHYQTAQASGNPLIVSLVRGSGAVVSYLQSGGSFIPQTPGCINSLVQDTADGLWKEITPDGKTTAYPLDTAGNVTSILWAQDSVGNRHTWAYQNGLPVGLQDSVGRQVTFGFSGGLLSSIEDWAGRRTTLQYDTASASPRNLLTTLIGPSGCQTQYQHTTFALQGGTSDWLLSGIVDPNGWGTSYLFDQQRRAVARILAGGGTTSFLFQPGVHMTVDASGAVTTHTTNSNFAIMGTQNAYGALVSFTRDSNNFELSRQDPTGAIATTIRDASSNVVGVVNPYGQRTTITRDAYNNPTSVQAADGTFVTNIWGYAGSPFDTTGEKRRLQATVDQLGNITSYVRNARGQTIATISPLGFITSFGLNNFGDVVSIQDALGNFETLTVDLAGNTIARMNPLGAVWSATFDPQNRPLTYVNPLGATVSLAYDSVGNTVLRIDELGYRTSTSFNRFNQAISRQDALGNFWTNTFDALSRLVSEINPLGAARTHLYDVASNPIALVSPLGTAVTTVRDNTGRAIATINELGYATSLVHDLMGRVVATVDALGNRSSSIFDVVGRTVATVDALGRYGTTVFDAASRPIARVDALGNGWTAVFDAAGRQVASVDPLNRTSTSVFDPLNRTIASIDALGFASSVLFDPAGRAYVTIDALGRYNTTVFDAADRAVASVSPLGYRTSTSFDLASQPIATQDALGCFHSSIFDPLGRVSVSIDPLGFASSNLFDAAGRQTASVDPLGHYSTNIFDMADRLIAQQDARGVFVSFVLDAASQQIAVVDGNGNRTSSLFDAASRLYASQDGLGMYTSLVLDAVGATLQRIDGRNLVTTNTVDALNRIVGQLYFDGTQATNTFDAAGQQLTMQDVTGVTQYGWDLASRLTSVQNGLGVPLSYTLDAVGNRLKMQDPHGSTLYSWDVQNRLIQIQNPQSQVTSMSWDALDRESSRVLGNGMQVLHTFDASGRETLLQNLSAAGTALAMFTSLYDAASNRTQLQELDGSVVNYGYDPIYQLQNEMRTGTNPYNTTYLNDPAGNRLQKIDSGQTTTGLFNSANELVLLTPPTGAPTTSLWDANGNLSVEQTGAALTSYTWSGENRLLFVDSSAGRSSYLYSADGLRQSAIEPPNTPNSGKSHFVWDAQNLLLRYDGSLALQDRYTDYPGYWGGLASQWRSGGNSSFYGFDPQGSTRILVSVAGVVTDSYSFKAFGEKLSESGTTLNPLRYEGQYGYYRDLDTRLYVRARHYEPAVGRWVSRDPLVGILVGPYLYALNDPQLRVDPSGAVSEPCRACRSSAPNGCGDRPKVAPCTPDQNIACIGVCQRYGTVLLGPGEIDICGMCCCHCLCKCGDLSNGPLCPPGLPLDACALQQIRAHLGSCTLGPPHKNNGDKARDCGWCSDGFHFQYWCNCPGGGRRKVITAKCCRCSAGGVDEYRCVTTRGCH